MPPRSNYHAAITEPFPDEEGTVKDLVDELIAYWGIQPAIGSLVVDCLGGNGAQVKSLKKLERTHCALLVSAQVKEAALVDDIITGLSVLIGTVKAPFAWEGGTDLKFNDTSSKKKRGGETQNLHSTLTQRRILPKEYFPPVQFDDHRVGSAKRNELTIRKLIPKEVWPTADVTLSCALV